MRMQVWLPVLAGVWALFLADGASAQKIYKWTDKDGRVHYSSTPPKDDKAEELAVRAAAASPDESDEEEGSDGDKQPEMADAEKKAAIQRNCQAARNNLASYQQSGALVKPGPDGRMVEVTEAERQAGIAEANQQIELHCKELGGG